MNLENTFRKVTKERIEAKVNSVAAGGAEDFAHYKAMVAEIKAYRDCLREFDDLYKQALEDGEN